MSNSSKATEENIYNNHYGFESALFIPATEKLENLQEEKFEDFNDLFISKSKFESSNNSELNEAQKRNLNIQSLISLDLMKKIEDSSPMKSAEAQKFGFMNMKFSPRVLFNKPEIAPNLYPHQDEDSNSNNFLEDALQANFTQENMHQFNSCFMQNPFLTKPAEESKNTEITQLIHETENNIDYDKFDSFEFGEINKFHNQEINKNINEEIMFSKLLESLNINNDSCLEKNDIINADLKSNSDLNMNFNNNKKVNELKFNNIFNNKHSENDNFGYSDNNGQMSSNLLQNININNNFNYNIGNGLPYIYYQNYLMSLNPYLLNANLLFKLNYLQKLQNYLLSTKTNNKAQSSNYQFGKAGWTCLYCNNFNYEIRIKCNRCGKPPQNKKDARTKDDENSTSIDNTSFINRKANPYSDEKNLIDNKNPFSKAAKRNIAENNKKYDILSNVNINSKSFIPNSFKESKNINKTAKSKNIDVFESKDFNNNNQNYPVTGQNQNRYLFTNKEKNLNNSSVQEKNHSRSDKINKFNYPSDCSANDEFLESKESRSLFGYSENSNMIDFVNNTICPDKSNLYSNAFIQNQFLYNKNTQTNKFNSYPCNITNNYLNNLKNQEIEPNFFNNINNNKKCGIEHPKANQPNMNKYNETDNVASQLGQRLNTVINPIDLQADKKIKKPFVERLGDWACLKCKNLNFSFRLACNRCQLSKLENEKLSFGSGKKSL